MQMEPVISPENLRAAPVTALVALNRTGLITLGVAGSLGGTIGALVTSRRLLGFMIGASFGVGLPLVATALILLPLRRISLGAPPEEKKQ